MFGMSILSGLFIIFGILISIAGLFANNIVTLDLPPVFLQLFRYGRANTSGGEKPAFLKLIEVPKSWFAHFYLYTVLIQSYVFITLVALYVFQWNSDALYGSEWLVNILNTVAGPSRKETVGPGVSLLVSFMFLIHVSRRYYETRYVCVYSDTKMNLAHYLVAFLHYTGSVLSLVASSPMLVSHTAPAPASLGLDWKTLKDEFSIFHLIGIPLFLYASLRQHEIHVALANLRKKGTSVISYRHEIPQGKLFELVSCPNYWTEIIIYTSFAFLFSFENVYWNSVLFWVVCNQVQAGMMNHIWYKEKFPEYPQKRKAVIPYLL